jgi:phosphoglycerate dehydrogenase-like enzyme
MATSRIQQPLKSTVRRPRTPGNQPGGRVISMTVRCVVLDDYQGVALDNGGWADLPDDVEVVALPEHYDTEDAVAEALCEAQVVVAMRERTPFRDSLLARLPALRLLVTSGMANAAIDLPAAAARGVTVCGTATSSEPTAELTWALIHGVTRHLAVESAAMRAGGSWQSTVGTNLHGATLGLLGFGKIGVLVARVGLAFGMRVQAWSPNLTAERTSVEGVRLAASKEELLSSSDIVSIHLRLGERSRGLLDAAALAAMKPTAFLVNTSRAPIVDADALLDALRSGTIAGAGLDVFETEPLPAGDPLRTLPNVLATPHLGYVTRDSYRMYYGEAVEDIQAFLAGSPIRVIN